MAKTPEFTAILSPTNYAPEPIVNRLAGFESTSSVERLADMAKVGAKAYEAYRANKIAGIREKITQDITPIIEEATFGSPSRKQEVMEEKAASEYALQALPYAQGPETGEQLDVVIGGVTSNLQKSLDFLSKAEKQNRMTPFELQQRSLSVVRKYLSDNPGLRKEILTTVSNALDDQGIMERLKFDETLLKSQGDAMAARDKEMRTEFKERNLAINPFLRDDGSIDERRASLFLDGVREEKYAFEATERALKSGEAVDKLTVRNLIQSGDHIKVANGYVRNAWSTASRIVNAGASYPDTVNSLELELDKLRGDLETSFASFTNDPTIKQTIQDTVSRIDSIKKTAKDAGSQENLKTYMNNRSIIDGIIDKNEIRGEVGNLERLELLSKFSTSPFLSKLIETNNTPTITKIIKDLANMEQGIRINANHLAKNGNAPSSAEIAFDTASDSIRSGNPNAVNMFSTNTADRVKAISNIPDVDDRFLQSESFVKQLAEPKNLQALNTLSVESKTEAFGLVLDNSKALVSSLKRLSDREGVQFTFSPDGKLSVSGVTKQENADVVDRINTNLSAFANLKGVSTKAASEEFFTSVYNNVFAPGQVPSMKDQIKTKVDEILPILTRIESGGKQFDKSGKLLTSPKGAQGKYQIMPETGHRPGFGIAPLDYTKTGKELEKDMERFAKDYLSVALTEFDGDSRKALASYNAGIQAVKTAVSKAARAGKPDEWVSNLPKETRDYLTKAAIAPEAGSPDLQSVVSTLRARQLAIQKSNPSVYDRLFKGSTVEMAKDIAADIAEKHGMAPTWQEVHQFLEKEGSVTPKKPVPVLPFTDNRDITNLAGNKG